MLCSRIVVSIAETEKVMWRQWIENCIFFSHQLNEFIFLDISQRWKSERETWCWGRKSSTFTASTSLTSLKMSLRKLWVGCREWKNERNENFTKVIILCVKILLSRWCWCWRGWCSFCRFLNQQNTHLDTHTLRVRSKSTMKIHY